MRPDTRNLSASWTRRRKGSPSSRACPTRRRSPGPDSRGWRPELRGGMSDPAEVRDWLKHRTPNIQHPTSNGRLTLGGEAVGVAIGAEEDLVVGHGGAAVEDARVVGDDVGGED